jgi:enolase
MALIKTIKAREILDSRGIPTLEGELETQEGIAVRAQIPSGESLGSHEGVELRDGDPKRYQGMGVRTAVSYVNNAIAPKLIGTNTQLQKDIDAWLLKADGTPSYKKLGVNTLMLISQLMLKASAAEAKKPLYLYVNGLYNATYGKAIKIVRTPAPIYNMINGGKHGTKNLDFQEFHLVPSTSKKFSETLEFAVTSYDGLKSLFEQRNADVSVSDEGGFTPNLFTNTEAFDIIKEVLMVNKIKLGVDIYMGVDCVAENYLKGSRYAIKDQAAPLSKEEYIKFLVDAANAYNMLILEDPLSEDDFDGWQKLTQEIGKQSHVVGDDFIAGNIDRLKKAAENHACNAVLVKFNQVGTISEMFQFVASVRDASMKLVVSHRMGETTDAAIADIAVGLQADFVKFGSPARGERIAKYNRLLEIESDLEVIPQAV